MPLLMKGVQVKDFSKIKFPKLASPKIDGFRCRLEDAAYTSGGKHFPNKYLHETFLGLLPKGVSLDGEIVVGKRRGPGVLGRTSSGLTSEEGKPEFTLWVFDAPRKAVTYKNRLKLAKLAVKDLGHPQVKYLKHVLVHDIEELEAYLAWALDKGFEGIMLDDPDAPHKEGKATLRENYRLKIKPFEDFEARIIGYFEEMENTNEVKELPSGKKRRSSKKEGKKPKGTLGGFIGLVIGTDQEVRVGGGFTKKQRADFWKVRDQMLGQIMKCRKQTVGEKDRPRHPTFIAIRPSFDMDIDSV
jgi:ATP-dependent DNA ligase